MPSRSFVTDLQIPNVLVNEDGQVTTVWSTIHPINRSRTWVNTTNFRSKVKGRKKRSQLADLPVNTMTEYNYYSDPTPQVIKYLNYTRSGSISGYFCAQCGIIPDLADSRFVGLVNKALSKLPKRMNGSSFNLPLFLMEARKTVDMVTNAAETLSKAVSEYSALSRKNKSGLLPWNAWMEYRYGWRLLVRDIYDGLCTLHDIQNFGVKQRVKVRATLDIPQVSTRVYPTYPFNNIFRWSPTPCTMLTDWHLAVDITLNYREWSSSLASLQQLGITNPVNLAWELVPYSFVIDWFVPIGDYLASLDRFLGKEFISGCISKTIETDSYTRLSSLSSSVYTWETFLVGARPVSRYRVRFHNRAPYSSFPSTSLPTIDVNLNCSRMIDAISMLTQRRKTLSSFAGSS